MATTTYIGDEISLDYLKGVFFEWLYCIRRNCVENGAWWDREKHRPAIGGIYVKLIYKTGKWVLLYSGMYDYGKPCYVKNRNKYLFKFKGINWIESDLEKEAERQYKEFLVYAKKYELEKDFEDANLKGIQEILCSNVKMIKEYHIEQKKQEIEKDFQ